MPVLAPDDEDAEGQEGGGGPRGKKKRYYN
jgi:hypothetical protein